MQMTRKLIKKLVAIFDRAEGIGFYEVCDAISAIFAAHFFGWANIEVILDARWETADPDGTRIQETEKDVILFGLYDEWETFIAVPVRNLQPGVSLCINKSLRCSQPAILQHVRMLTQPMQGKAMQQTILWGELIELLLRTISKDLIEEAINTYLNPDVARHLLSNTPLRPVK